MRTVYLDNAATSFPKPMSVSNALLSCVRDYCGNPGRSSHPHSQKTAEKIYEARERVALLLGCNTPERVVFTSGATHALNIAIKGLLNHKCHVIISDLEHNAVLRPLRAVCERYGISVSEYDSDLHPKEAIEPLVRADTEFIITTLASNLTGRCIDTAALSKVAREHRISIIADASQYLGHKALDLSSAPFEVVCAPGHKALFGIQGAGFALFNGDFEITPLIEGGSGSDSFNREMPIYLPERLEAGTLPTPAIIAMSEGIRFLCDEYGINNAEKKLKALTDAAIERLCSVKGVKVLSAGNGIVALNFEGISSERIAAYLGERGICVRGGFHCAPSAHRKLGSENVGAVRVSFSIFNSISDIDALRRALLEI